MNTALLLRRAMMVASGHHNFPDVISFVSPEGTTPATLAAELGVDITTKVIEVGLPTAQFIYSVTTVGTTHAAPTTADSYTFGSSLDPVTTQTSNLITFTAGSTGRFVIYNYDNTIIEKINQYIVAGATWMYHGKNILNNLTSPLNTSIKYIHRSSEWNFQFYANNWQQNSVLTGIITIPLGMSTIDNMDVFSYCPKIQGITLHAGITSIAQNAFWVGYTSDVPFVFKSYRSTAPAIGTSTFYLVPKAGTLHVPVGATGYTSDNWNLSPNYYNLFTSINYDL